MISILVVDDTILYRKLVSDIAGAIPGVRVVGTASNGRTALSRIALLKPDLVTLDVEMPQMNGIEVLEAARREGFESSFLMVSAITTRGADLSLRAIELGAMDAVAKPDGASVGRDDFTNDLRARIENFARRGEIRKILKGRESIAPSAPVQARSDPPPRGKLPAWSDRYGPRLKRSPCGIVAIGVSTGGPAALLDLIPALPEGLGVPVLIVQHMPALFTASLACSLNNRGKLAVKEGEDGEVVRPGVVYVAPGDRQMRVDLGAYANAKIIRITDDPPQNHCRPSVDYLFASIARHYYGRALALVMTGMGEDGSRGAFEIKKAGGEVIVQDEESSVVWGMPGAVVARGLEDGVYPLGRLAAQIIARSRP